MNLQAAILFFISGHSESFTFNIHRQLCCEYLLRFDRMCTGGTISAPYILRPIAAECGHNSLVI